MSLVGRNPLYSVLYPSIDNVPMLKPIKYKTIKHLKKQKGQSKMDNPETLATLGKKYPDRRQAKKKHTIILSFDEYTVYKMFWIMVLYDYCIIVIFYPNIIAFCSVKLDYF